MPSYFLDEDETNGVHEVHAKDCSHLPDRFHRIYLGEYPNSRLALKKAAQFRKNVGVCPACGEKEIHHPQPYVVRCAS
ncbi:hypothetical protein [Hoeflea sp.]|uniref:hypothetical protein n=1 Tax=Hoeflea sp. TaxID=1940281 RepID=UPI003B0281C6